MDVISASSSRFKAPTLPAVLTGRSLTGFIVIVFVAETLPPLPSTTVYERLTVPTKFESGVNLYLVLPSFSILPSLAVKPSTDRVSPSTSEYPIIKSLIKMSKGVSSVSGLKAFLVVVRAGASLTGETTIEAVPLDVPVPSETTYEIWAVPLKFNLGSYFHAEPSTDIAPWSALAIDTFVTVKLSWS